jgi:Alginate lyase
MNKIHDLGHAFVKYSLILTLFSLIGTFGVTRFEGNVANAQTSPQVNSIIQVGNKYLSTPLMSVTTSDKSLSASTDPHNYVSLSPYSWPNPNTASGLPYIVKDGQRNPALSNYTDYDNLGTLLLAVSKLTDAYQVTGDEKYSTKAIALLNYWFVNPVTRMNPNLDYAQIIPGQNGNRGNAAGIIDTHNFTDLAQDIIVLFNSQSASSTFKSGISQWFYSYVNWLATSPNGQSIAAGHNNQKTWYMAQIISIEQAMGRSDLAITNLQNFIAQDLPIQLSASGQQLQEISRTKAFDYSVFNLTGLFKIAGIAKTLNIDLWHYKIENRQSFALKVALDYLIPYATAQQTWPYQQITPADIKGLSILMDQAEVIYPYAADSYSNSEMQLKAFSTN